jgi:hypothetical protein
MDALDRRTWLTAEELTALAELAARTRAPRHEFREYHKLTARQRLHAQREVAELRRSPTRPAGE